MCAPPRRVASAGGWAEVPDRTTTPRELLELRGLWTAGLMAFLTFVLVPARLLGVWNLAAAVALGFTIAAAPLVLGVRDLRRAWLLAPMIAATVVAFLHAVVWYFCVPVAALMAQPCVGLMLKIRHREGEPRGKAGFALEVMAMGLCLLLLHPVLHPALRGGA